jgi:peroxiredoxin
VDPILVVALILPWLLVVVLVGLLYLTIRQQGRILLLRDELAGREAAAATPAMASTGTGLPVGASAPDFSLPGLDGRERSLADYAGQRLLLIFFDPSCGFCQQLAPELGRLSDQEPRVVLMSRGDPEDNRRMALEHGWRCDVVLEDGWDVARAYQATGTPMGYLVDRKGRIASGLAVGQAGLLALAGRAQPQSTNRGVADLLEKERATAERARAAGIAVRDIGTSRLDRRGLAAGTTAPDFSLPDLDGEERSLAEYRGRKVLLVFSDPDCGPCDSLAPDLVTLSRRDRRDDLQVVMVSRGDRERNRAKARHHGYDFPVLLQRGWEVSKAYAMFATPVAYLIDEAGVIARDVAVGADAIRALA